MDLNPEDMSRRGIADGALVRVKSRRGALVLRAHASDEIRAGQAFLAMHWGANVLVGSGTNLLTHGANDPWSRQPELKHAAVQVEAVTLPHQALLLRSEADAESAQAQALPRLRRAAALLGGLDYAAVTLAGRDHPAVVVRIAHGAPLSDALLAQLDAALDLDDSACLSYRDTRRGISKRALVADGVLVGVRLTGELAAAGWLRDTMLERLPTQELRRWLLAPVSAPPVAAPGRGRIVCNCFDVAEREIAARIGVGAKLEQLQAELNCGTSCGSCVPELKRMLATGARTQ